MESASSPTSAPWYADPPLVEAVTAAMLAERAETLRLPVADAAERRTRFLRDASVARILALLESPVPREGPLPDLAVGERVLRLLQDALPGREDGPGDDRAYLLRQASLLLGTGNPGHEAVRAFLADRASHIRLLPDTLDALFELHEQAATLHGETEAAGAYLLFLATGSVQRAREIVAAHGGPPEAEGPSFLRQLLGLLAETGQAISIQHARGGTESGTNVAELVHHCASATLMSPRVSRDRGSQLDLRAAMAEWLCRADTPHILTRRALKEGSFETKKVGTLARRRVPPSTLANTLERLDANEEYVDLLHAVRDLRATRANARPTDDSTARASLMRLQAVLARLQTAACRSLSAPLRVACLDLSSPDDACDEELVAWLEQDHGALLEQEFSTLDSADPPREIGLLLSLMAPERIVDDPDAQRAFLDAYDRLPALPRSVRPETAEVFRETLCAREAFLYLPLQPCASHPHHRGRTLCELLESAAEQLFPGGSQALLPTLTYADLGVPGIDSLGKDFSGAIEPVYEDRSDLRGIAEALKREWGDEKFARSWGLLEAELKTYLGADGDAHWMMPHKSASELFHYLMDGLFPTMDQKQNVVITSQEYDDMLRRKVGEGEGRAAPRMVLRRDHKDRPLGRKALLSNLLKQVDKQTRFVVLSLVSRYGDMLLGRSDNPPQDLLWMIRKLRHEYPELVIVLDACQAVGRAELPALRDLDERTVMLCTGGKMLGVSQFGFAAVPAGLASSIQQGHGYDTRLPPDTLRTTSILTLFQRLRELRSPHRRCDTVNGAQSSGTLSGITGTEPHPRPAGERIRLRLQALTAKMLALADEHADAIYPHVQHLTYLRGIPEHKAKKLLACHIFAPSGRVQAGFAGIVTLSLRTLPPATLVSGLSERGFQSSGSRMENTCARFALHEFHRVQDVEDLFRAILEIHIQHLRQLTVLAPEDKRAPELAEERRTRY